MFMLAEPRRKRRVGPNPRGKFFTDDEQNKGRNLLEKMGWTSGNGLGVQRQGIKEPIKPKIQVEESRGLGFDVKSDPWMEHMDGFTAVLQNLQQTYSNSAEKDEEECEEKEGFELEKRSKTSKSRIHYEKFVKNKDLSKIQKQDWTCIFGKTDEPKEEAEEPNDKSSESGLCFSNPILFEDREEEAEPSNYNTINNFRSRMAKMFVRSTLPEDQPRQPPGDDVMLEEGGKAEGEGTKKKRKKEKSKLCCETPEDPEEAKPNSRINDFRSQMAKMFVRSTLPEDQPKQPTRDGSMLDEEANAEGEGTKKKRKKKKSKLCPETPEDDSSASSVPPVQPTEDGSMLEEEVEAEGEGVRKKKKRKKEKSNLCCESTEDDPNASPVSPAQPAGNDQMEMEVEAEDRDASAKVSKKKKSKKGLESQEEDPTIITASPVSVPGKPRLNPQKRARFDYSAEDAVAAASLFKGSNLMLIPGYRTQSNKVL